MARGVGAPLGATQTGLPAPGWRVWLLAIRPRTLPAAVAPIVVGTAIAVNEDGFHALAAGAALVVAVLLQVAANLANDLFDFRRGADAARVGPTRVTQSGFVSPQVMFRVTGLVLAVATLCGLVLVWRGGWPILLLGAAALAAAVAYTAGPFPLGYHGLGDLFVFLFFGLAGVTGSAYVQTLDLTRLSVLAAVPVGCLATAIIVVNNLRDRDTDRAARKRTLAVRLGRGGTIAEYTGLLAVAYLFPPALRLGGLLSGWFWLPLLSLTVAWPLLGAIRALDGAALNPVLAATARLALVYSLLFAASIVL